MKNKNPRPKPRGIRSVNNSLMVLLCIIIANTAVASNQIQIKTLKLKAIHTEMAQLQTDLTGAKFNYKKLQQNLKQTEMLISKLGTQLQKLGGGTRCCAP